MPVNKDWRKRVFQVIETSDGNDTLSTIYDYFMIAVIVVSLIPLAFKETSTVLLIIDWVTVVIYIADYIFRLLTADYKLQMGKKSFVLYPFTPLAIIDLVCILPSFAILANSFRVLKVVRLVRALRVFRAMRVFRAAKIARYSRSLLIIVDVVREQSAALLAVLGLAIGYVIISALIVFNVEPDTFNSFFDAIYWAAVSLTTVGYGDIYPVTAAGRIVTIISSFFGIAIVALPAGILTAGYMDKLNNQKK